MQTYYECLERLFSVNQFNGVKLGLSNMITLCASLDNAEKRFPCVHVAGTNGKGSVTTKIAAAFQLQGLRVGRYTSPHISTFRERICINGEMISENAVSELLQKVFSAAESASIDATFFELTTALAFLYFTEQQVDIAVLETGLGGRLDCTNIVDPLLSVITSISFDHTEVLGHSLEEIAKEKAGIIKPERPVVIGPRVPLSVIAPIAHAHNSVCEQVLGKFDDYNAENSAIARRCLQLLNVPEKFISLSIHALPPCRLENIPLDLLPPDERPRAVILDVAHNPDGLQQLMRAIQLRFPDCPYRLVCGLSKSKDLHACATLLAKYGFPIHCIEADSPRALPALELLQALKNAGLSEDKLFMQPSLNENLNSAFKIAHMRSELVIVCGSFFIMAEVRKYCGLEGVQDQFHLNEINAVASIFP